MNLKVIPAKAGMGSSNKDYSMRIFLLRHGDYLANDIAAPLSKKGRKEILSLGSLLKPLHLPIKHIFHSGKLRAQQTAEIISNFFICDEDACEKKGLAPNDDVNGLIEEINISQNDILFVGHLPFLSKLTSKLVVGDENKEIIFFQTGTLVCLEK